jgi:Xaa-Pro aminopeptidase
MRKAFLAATLILFSFVPLPAERTGYPPEEFTARRKALASALGQGTVVLFGKTMPAVSVRFRQDNDFYYFTGNEDLNAVFVMDAATAASWLFLPAQSAGEIRSDGKNWLTSGEAQARGFEGILPLTELNEFLARRRAMASGPPTLWTRLSDADTLRTRYPFYDMKDVTPAVDALRVIKTPREIEILKRNGRISAEAIRKAIEITRPGRYEYELEAEATYHLLKNGVQGNGYPAIVGTGANVNVWHYQNSGRQMQAGDLVVMDYGGSLDYQVVDITRTWPVSGQFDELQLKAYRCALETQKAIIAAMKPGATRLQTRDIAKAIYEKYGFANQPPTGAGHFVGMSVHDVGNPREPFRPGMVIAVEPIIEIPEKQLHIRIEDTVLVTDNEPLILSASVPKEVDEVLALIKGQS